MSPATELLGLIETPSSPLARDTVIPPFSNPPSASSPAPSDTKECNPYGASGCSSPRKRCFEFSLPSEEPAHPIKRAKKILTTISAKREKEFEHLHTVRMFQLARATREAFAAHVRYREKRMHELDVMRMIAYDEREEAASLLKVADLQIGELQHVINGMQIATSPPLRLSPLSTPYFGSFSERISQSVSASSPIVLA